MKTGITTTNYWSQKVQYAVRGSAQDFIFPHSVLHKNALIALNGSCSGCSGCGTSCDIAPCDGNAECGSCSV